MLVLRPNTKGTVVMTANLLGELYHCQRSLPLPTYLSVPFLSEYYSPGQALITTPPPPLSLSSLHGVDITWTEN